METIEAQVAPVKRHVRYRGVNGQWPAEMPPLTGPEAVSAAKRLWRAELGKRCPHRVRAGDIRGGRSAIVVYDRTGSHLELVVDTRGGWKGLVHSLSHRIHSRQHPGAKPHAFSHEMLEKRMVQMVLEKGWLSGSLKRPEKPKVERPVREIRHERIIARLASWERKARRAATAIKKLKRQRAYYERMAA